MGKKEADGTRDLRVSDYVPCEGGVIPITDGKGKSHFFRVKVRSSIGVENAKKLH